MHFSPLRTLKFIPAFDIVVSTDDNGVVEIWDPETYDFPESSDRLAHKKLSFDLISDTDFLPEFIRNKTCALSCTLSNNGLMIAFYCRDRKIRVFSIRTGKLVRSFDETLQSYID